MQKKCMQKKCMQKKMQNTKSKGAEKQTAERAKEMKKETSVTQNTYFYIRCLGILVKEQKS